ncbi:hypothetical protein [Pseudodesulfovibrio sediminis]|uniref:Uncharacterized protein n=1 Tax=Pseudodesulfovibrio sediminis TaxID=2810563 RepID=A0ABM7P8E9_9BACT|nr:hypothetical protein [Pseudodesulfovibrio sediminis]BCS89300.1 hypothetical protein PSDVSF_25420 [Pseudodesulfovibrio sediminis]
MKKIAIPLILLATLLLCAAALAATWNLTALKAEAAKAVPDGKVMASSADEYGALVGVQAEGTNYQFTLSTDQDPQAPTVHPFSYKGHKAFFFEVGMPGSGGLMILLGNDKSLTILCMVGMDADEDPDMNALTAIADKMDLGAL